MNSYKGSFPGGKIWKALERESGKELKDSGGRQASTASSLGAGGLCVGEVGYCKAGNVNVHGQQIIKLNKRNPAGLLFGF